MIGQHLYRRPMIIQIAMNHMATVIPSADYVFDVGMPLC